MDSATPSRDDLPDLPDEHRATDNERVNDASSLAQRFSASLTVIKGNAQLIRRRAKELNDDDAAVLERSSVAIELAVQRMVLELAVIGGTSAIGDGALPDERG